jgi:hypothetical protein
MEREAAYISFGDMFSMAAEDIYPLMDIVDEGKPLPQNVSHPALWCMLKMFLDCLPTPLLSAGALGELKKRGIGPRDFDKQHTFLVEFFKVNANTETTFLALYLASFLHTMCQNASDRACTEAIPTVVVTGPTSQQSVSTGSDQRLSLTPALCAKTFASCFFGSNTGNKEHIGMMPTATAVIKVLIEYAEEPELWTGNVPQKPDLDRAESGESSSSEDEEDDEWKDDSSSPA